MSQDKNRRMTFFLELSGDQPERARKALEQAGIAFRPEDQMFMGNESADLDHHCSADDLPAILEAINSSLEESGSRRRLPETPGGMSLGERWAVMEMGHLMMTWNGNRMTGDDRLLEDGGVVQVIERGYPELRKHLK